MPSEKPISKAISRLLRREAASFTAFHSLSVRQAGRRSSSLLASSKRSASRRISSMKGWLAGERSWPKSGRIPGCIFCKRNGYAVFLTDGESGLQVGQGLFIVTQLIKSSGELDFQIERAEQVG